MPSSMFNGDFNIGAFIGYRCLIKNKFGISFVSCFGFSSLNQNASNNTSIKDTTSQSMPSITYGTGLIFDCSKKFQLDIVAGKDNGFDKLSTNYISQNKTRLCKLHNVSPIEWLTYVFENINVSTRPVPYCNLNK